MINRKPTKYIVFEGGEGTYKSSTMLAVARGLRDLGYSVIETKEPGTDLIPLTMELRKIMLDNKYDDMLPPYAREFVSQAIRQIHIEKLIRPVYAENKYDFILQDRGILSGVIYANACGVPFATQLTPIALGQPGVVSTNSLYDLTIVHHRKQHSLNVATTSKSEFETGDAMESRGNEFHTLVADSFRDALDETSSLWTHASTRRIVGIDVDMYDGKPQELVEVALKKVMREYFY